MRYDQNLTRPALQERHPLYLPLGKVTFLELESSPRHKLLPAHHLQVALTTLHIIWVWFELIGFDFLVKRNNGFKNFFLNTDFSDIVPMTPTQGLEPPYPMELTSSKEEDEDEDAGLESESDGESSSSNGLDGMFSFEVFPGFSS